ADLSRRGWGLGATREGGELRVWRGEHFRTRLWRILHELRAPAPNKRMNIEHTSGRVYPGELRAHPGWMEEITATVVPGERVFVDFEGGWGRHLPTIDDLLSVLSGKPLRVFSSHGLTTLESSRSFGDRLRDYVDLSWRYAPLAQMRLSSLGSTEPRERRAFLAHLEERYGLVARFTPYPHASVEEWERTVSPHLRALFPHDPSPEPESTAEPELKKRRIA
ncbi:MAG TPA: hypothetical protein VMV18_15875, partial [bacterium]|nr:hypothetical protein [bacterium]